MFIFYLSILPKVLICFKSSLAECDMPRNISSINKDILTPSFPVWHPFLASLVMLFSVLYFGTISSKTGKSLPCFLPDFNGNHLSYSQFGIASTKHLLFVIPNAFAYMHMYVCGYVCVDTKMYSCVCMNTYMEAGSWCWMSSLIFLHLIYWGRVSHRAWSLAI